MGLRLKTGLDLGKLEKESGKKAKSDLISSFHGLAYLKEGALFPTLRGRLLNDFLARSLMDYFLE